MRAHPLMAVRARIADFRAVFAVPAFATYQAGNLIMTTGFWMQRVGVGWVTWEMTQSETWLGVVAFAELFPSILTALWGGAVADRHPAPQIMFWGQLASAAVAVALALMYMADAMSPIGMVVVMAALGAVSGVLLPARLAMASHLAPKELLPSALAVNSTGFNLSRFVGPALAAGLLVVGSAGLVFTISAIGFLVLAAALYRIRDVPPLNPRPAAAAGPIRMSGVVRDLARTPAILAVIGLQAIQGLLIRPASELFPAYSEVAFGKGEAGLGMLNAALGVGAILGALLMTKSREPRAAITQIMIMSCLFALTLLAFAATPYFTLALLILVGYGATMSSSNIAALAFVQLQSPQDRLGRILSLYTIVFRVGPALGAFLFGVTADGMGLGLTGALFALGGLVATVGVGLWLAMAREWIR